MALLDVADQLLASPRRDDVASPLQGVGQQLLAVTFAAPDGPTVLLASWGDGSSPDCHVCSVLEPSSQASTSAT